jgi:hypothetical protein
MVNRIAALVLLFKLALMPANAAENVTGSWSIRPQAHGSSVYLLVRVEGKEPGFFDETGTDFDAAELGLKDAPLATEGGKIAISLTREAGSLAGSGIVAQGGASGSFTFTPSAAYRTAIAGRGYPELTPLEQLRATMENVSLAFADAIAAAGYHQLPFDKLVQFRALGIDGPYIATERTTFPTSALGADLLLQLAALRVTPGYVADVRAAGFAVDRPEAVLQLRALNIDRAYVRDLASAGYAHLTSGELIGLRALRIDAAYIKRVEAYGIARPTVDQLMRLRAMNIVRASSISVTS